jgi:hypothetical protein
VARVGADLVDDQRPVVAVDRPGDRPFQRHGDLAQLCRIGAGRSGEVQTLRLVVVEQDRGGFAVEQVGGRADQERPQRLDLQRRVQRHADLNQPR